MRLLPRSATGQQISNYFSLLSGPRRAGDLDGPEHMYYVLVDAGRTGLLGGDFEEMLRCIRCGACMNHCPVYQKIGGHAYGWVYPGPIGSVLTPQFLGVKQAADLPNASTFCGRCESVCPMKIPLPSLLRHWREAEFACDGGSRTYRAGLKLWAFFARRPRLYGAAARLGIPLLRALARGKGSFRRLPGAGGWTRHRDLPAPQGRTFQQLWAERQAGVER
jgi:L-lactate dehydrogenase complex protein LldF